MTSALTKDRKTTQHGVPPQVDPSKMAPLLATGAEIFGGSMVAINVAGAAVKASADPSLRIIGRNERYVNHANGDLRADVRRGTFWMANGTGGDALTVADVMQPCFAINDNSVARNDGGGARPKAGWVVAVDDVKGVAVALGMPSLYDAAGGVSGGAAFVAKGMGPATNVASLSSFTVASNDGNTYAAGDVVVLYAQTTESQNGPYVVGTVTSTTAPLTRPSWWEAGAGLTEMRGVKVVSGTLFGGTTWRSFAASGVVDTDAPSLFPERVTQSATIASAGGVAITNVPIRSATKSNFIIDRTATGGTVTSTVDYNAVSITAGAVGSGSPSVTLQAQVAAGTANASDTSTFNFTILN